MSAEIKLELCPSCGEPAKMFTVPDHAAYCANTLCDGALEPDRWNRMALADEAFALLERWVVWHTGLGKETSTEINDAARAILARVQQPEPEPGGEGR